MKQIILCFGLLFFIQSICYSQTVQRNFADVNGDTKLDKIEYKDYGGNIVDIIVSIGNLSGSYDEPFIFCSQLDRGYPDKQWGFADVNCDAKADFITIRGVPEKLEQVIYLSTGNGLDVKNKIFNDYNGSLVLKIYRVIEATGPYQGPWGFDRGMATTMHCGKSPESWVRGSAKLDQASGILFVTVQLETDAIHAGPKGVVTAVLKDCEGNAIANATTDEIGTGGKGLDGHAAIRNFSSRVKIDPKIACKVCSIYLTAQCTGSVDRIINLSLGTVEDAFKIGVKIFSGQ